MIKKILIFILIGSMLLCLPVSARELYPDLALVGKTSLLIPEVGKTEFNYSAAFLDNDGNLIPTDEILIDVTDLPDGVKYKSGLLTVFDYAEEGSSFTFTLTPPENQPKLHQKEIEITLGYNLLENGLFTDLPKKSGWDTKNSSSFEIENNVLTFNYHENSTATYLLTQANEIPLKGGELYEVSFDIKGGSDDNDLEMSLEPEIIGSSAVIYLENPSFSEWTHLTAPLKAEDDGSYIFSLAITPDFYHNPISIRNLTLKPTYKKPVDISVSVPQSFSVPKSYDITTPLDILVIDLEGEKIEASLLFEALEENENVKIEDGILTITTEAAPGKYDFSVSLLKNPEIKKTFSIVVTDSGIDNGNFESDQSDLTWLATGDGEYKTVRENRNSYATFTPNSSVGLMYNNAFVSFKAEENYVFKADLKNKFSDTHLEVTFIIEDLENPDNLILCAYFIPTTRWDTYKAVFTPEEDINGRFIVAVNVPEGSDEQVLYMDNIEVIPALISAERVRIKGTARVGHTMTGSYNFVNNFDGESATITNWALSENPDGPYITLSYSNMTEIEITEDMVGKYLRYEVTPISLTAGIFGETVYSEPVKIARKSTDVTYKDPEEEKPDTPAIPDEPLKDSPSYISPIDISAFYGGENKFSDLDGHWAAEDINALALAKVTEGYKGGSFAPDKNVTRAEFCAFLIRSLSLDEGIYKGAFSDVSPQSWYAGVIQTVYNCGLILGTSEKEFSPNAPITKEQMITIIMRTLNLLGKDAAKDAEMPKDFDMVSPYAKDALSKAVSLGLIVGDEDGFINPQKPTTRAEAITILCRFLKMS